MSSDNQNKGNIQTGTNIALASMNTAYQPDQPAGSGDSYRERPTGVVQQPAEENVEVTQPGRSTTTHYEDLDKKGMDKKHEYQGLGNRKARPVYYN